MVPGTPYSCVVERKVCCTVLGVLQIGRLSSMTRKVVLRSLLVARPFRTCTIRQRMRAAIKSIIPVSPQFQFGNPFGRATRAFLCTFMQDTLISCANCSMLQCRFITNLLFISTFGVSREARISMFEHPRTITRIPCVQLQKIEKVTITEDGCPSSKRKSVSLQAR